MSDKLELKVVFSAVDKFLRPVKNITAGASEAAKALRDTNTRMKDLNRTLAQVDAFKKAEKDAAIAANAFKGTRDRIAALKAEIASVGVPTKAMASEMEQLSRKSADLKARHESLINTQQKLFSQLKAGGVDTGRLADESRRLAAASVEAANASKKFSAALEVENQKMKRLHAARADLAKSKELSGKLATTGAGMAAGGVAVGLPIAMATKDFASFETAMLGVARQVNDARDANGKLTATYYEIGDAVKSMSERLPMSANELAKIVEGGARMGIQGKENLITYAELTAVMSTAFDLPVDKIGEDIGKISQLYHVPMKDIRALGDTINWLDDNALAKGGDIIDVMKRIAGTADMVKMNFKDAAALGSTFLSLGAVPEVAASASNAMMRELSIATMQKGRFQAGLKMLNMDAKSVQMGMTKDATGTIIRVMEAIKALPQEKQLEAATRLFGKEYGDDAAKLASNMEEYRRQLALVNAEKAKGSMQRESNARNDTLDARMTMAKDAFTNLSSTLGQHLKGPLVETLERTLSIVQAVREWSKENPGLAGGLMTVVKWLAVGLSALGGIAIAAGSVLGPMALLKYWLTSASTAGNATATNLLAIGSRLWGIISP
ncbi:MAG TPA: phage tail tape measure protein, partial [Rhodocyclaceae bacterium]|nr:phage tail tape measure protein [Rhodocyclaceae bacterium]